MNEARPASSAFLAIHHVQLAMPAGGEAEARAFHVGVLGFTEVAKPEALAGRGGAWFEAGPVRVHVGVDPEFHPARKAHPALLVASLDAVLERCRAAGIAVDPAIPIPGHDRVYVTDPFGNRIELIAET